MCTHHVIHGHVDGCDCCPIERGKETYKLARFIGAINDGRIEFVSYVEEVVRRLREAVAVPQYEQRLLADATKPSQEEIDAVLGFESVQHTLVRGQESLDGPWRWVATFAAGTTGSPTTADRWSPNDGSYLAHKVDADGNG